VTRAKLSRAADALLVAPVHRPVATLVVMGALIALALVGVSRLRPDTSLQAMFARNDPAADALVRVLDRFSGAEELLVLVTTSEPDPPKLIGFAERFEKALTSSADADRLVDAVLYRADDDTARFFREQLVPAGMFYLDDQSFADARRRLTPDGMRQQLARTAAALRQPSPAAAAAAKVIAKNDPLRLHEFLLSRMAGVGAFGGGGGGLPGENGPEGETALLSPDQRALLIRVIGKASPSDLAFSKALVDAATRAKDASNAGGLSVSFGGAYAIATTSERALRADSSSSVTGAFVSLIVLFAIVYRRPLRLLVLAVFPLALGSLLGFGAYAVADRSMTILSAAVGAMMVGMGIDYSIHYLTHYEKLRGAGMDAVAAATESSRGLFGALFAAWITSVMGFAVVGFSRIPALGTFALLGSLGLGGVYLTSLTVVPALLMLTEGRRRKKAASEAVGGRARLRFSVEPLLAWVMRHARTCIVVSLVVFFVALGIGLFLPGPILPLEPDLSVMHPRPNPALETQAEIARRFGSVPGSLIVYLRAQTPEQLIALAHEVDRRLQQPGPRDAGVVGTIGLATVLPDPTIVQKRLGEISPGEADRVVADFRAALADSDFDGSRYDGYARFLHTLLSRREAPTIHDLLKYRRLAQIMLPAPALQPGAALPTDAITLISLSHPIDERESRAAAVNSTRQALADLPGVTLTGLPVMGHDAEAGVQRQVAPLFFLSLAMVLGYVIIHFRSPRDAALSLTTAVFGMVVLLAVMRLSGTRLNMINLIALPLLIGMTVDYGIFLVSLARLGREHDPHASPESLLVHIASAGQAVLVCAGATLLGFGSLAWISVPAVRSLGIVVVIGMVSALAGAFFLLAPVLLLPPRAKRMKKGQAPAPAPASIQDDSETA
jgi:predicted RND superfamily exporter protein